MRASVEGVIAVSDGAACAAESGPTCTKGALSKEKATNNDDHCAQGNVASWLDHSMCTLVYGTKILITCA